MSHNPKENNHDDGDDLEALGSALNACLMKEMKFTVGMLYRAYPTLCTLIS